MSTLGKIRSDLRPILDEVSQAAGATIAFDEVEEQFSFALEEGEANETNAWTWQMGAARHARRGRRAVA